MSQDKFPRWLYWGLLITFIVVNSYYLFPVFRYLQPTLVLIVTAALLAFLLNYPVKLLVTWKLKRGYAIALVFLLALIILSTITLTLLPLLFQQLNEFPRRLPSWIDSSKVQLQALEVWAIDKNLPFDVSAFIIQLEERFATEVRALPAYVINFALGAFDSSLELLITVVLTFYLLIHGDRFWSGIWQWLPDDWERNRFFKSIKAINFLIKCCPSTLKD